MKNRHHILYIAAILLLTIFLYSNSITNDFVNWDDDISVQLNKDIHSFDKQHVINMFNNSYNGMYQPMVMLSYAVNYAVHGLQPAGYHLTNLLFHLLNIVLLYVFVKMLFRNTAIAMVAAVVFAIHPMHVESVSWITERKDVLYAFFYLLSLILYIKYIQSDFRKKFLILAFLSFLLSLFSKTNAITFPVIMIIIDWYYKRTVNRKLIIEKVVFLIFAIIFGLIAIKSQQVLDVGAFKNVQYSIIDRMFIACHAFIFYIVKFLFPFHLSALYPFPLKTNGFLPLNYYLSIFVLIVLVFFSSKLLLSKSVTDDWKRQLALSAIFYIVTISIVIFIPVGKADVADRYTYIPFVGLAVFFYLIFDVLAKSWIKHLKIIIAAGLIILFSILAFQRNKVWKDSGTLWSDVIWKYPTSEVAFYGRANFKQAQKDFTGALIDYNKAIDLNPDFALALNNRGAVKLYLKDLNGSLKDLNRSALIDPKDKWVFYNRALVYFNQGLNHLGCIDLEKSARLGNKSADELINKFCK